MRPSRRPPAISRRAWAREGSDELARLSRAFDSLLSDLREKSDMEGYVGNLARFLPEPGQEGSGLVVHTQPLAAVVPARREAAVLLGLEYRHLLTQTAQLPPDQIVDDNAQVQKPGSPRPRLPAGDSACVVQGHAGPWRSAVRSAWADALAVLRDEFCRVTGACGRAGRRCGRAGRCGLTAPG